MKPKTQPTTTHIVKPRKAKKSLPDYTVFMDRHHRIIQKERDHYYCIGHICLAKSYDDWLASEGDDA